MTTTALSLPKCFRRVRLELAREREHPTGSAAIGYEFVAPLSADGRLDAAQWKAQRDHCRVIRSRPGEPHDLGRLVHRQGGSWAFRYDDMPDEAGCHFQDERFVPGEYVSFRTGDEEHTFKVVSALPL